MVMAHREYCELNQPFNKTFGIVVFNTNPMVAIMPFRISRFVTQLVLNVLLLFLLIYAWDLSSGFDDLLVQFTKEDGNNDNEDSEDNEDFMGI